MDGFLLDVTSEPERGEVSAWVLRPGGGAVRLSEPFVPVFYVRGRAPELATLRRDLEAVPGLGELSIVRRICGLEDEPCDVLSVPVREHGLLLRLARLIDGRGGYRDLALYDVDLRMSQRWTIAKGLFPFAKLRAWGNGRFTLRDEKWAVEYELPPLRMLHLDATPDAVKGEIATDGTPVGEARLGDETFTGDEESILRALASAVARVDPDVVTTRGGDAFLLRWLAARAKACGLGEFRLGREAPASGEASGIEARRKGRSFFTYGKIKYQPPVVGLKGRIHLDLDSSFFFQEAGLAGLLDLARVSNIPLAEVARLGAGTAITAIQIDVAKREGRVVPWKKADPEPVKTARTLLDADRGGYIYEPAVGAFEDVVELDFASLYPNIMVTRNLSPETMQCRCCAPETVPFDRRVPQVGYHVCARRVGFIPRSLAPVLRRREHFKRMRKERPAEAGRYKEMSDAYKWLLVTSFGYQGYKNAKFGRIDCHESISAWGREILLTASEVARDRGFETVHGIVDSLWLRRVVAGADASGLGEAVEREVGIRFEYQGRYDWIVFLPTRSHNEDPHGPAVGALNRYYGCFDEPIGTVTRSNAGQRVKHGADPRLKVRGVELCQHSTPPFLCLVQQSMLNALALAKDRAELLARVPCAVEAVRPHLARLLAGDVPVPDLLFAKRTSQEAEQYRVWNETRSAIHQLARRGVRVAAGEGVRYVVLDEDARDPAERVRPQQLLCGDETYDREAYARHVLRAAESLLLPFGWTAERVGASLAGTRQLDLGAFA